MGTHKLATSTGTREAAGVSHCQGGRGGSPKDKESRDLRKTSLSSPGLREASGHKLEHSGRLEIMGSGGGRETRTTHGPSPDRSAHPVLTGPSATSAVFPATHQRLGHTVSRGKKLNTITQWTVGAHIPPTKRPPRRHPRTGGFRYDPGSLPASPS